MPSIFIFLAVWTWLSETLILGSASAPVSELWIFQSPLLECGGDERKQTWESTNMNSDLPHKSCDSGLPQLLHRTLECLFGYLTGVETLELVEKTGITARSMLQHLLCWDNFVFNGRTWVRVEKYIRENCLWGFVCFYTLLHFIIFVHACAYMWYACGIQGQLGGVSSLFHCGPRVQSPPLPD